MTDEKTISDDTDDKLSNLKPRDILMCKSEDFVHLDWFGEWKAFS